ncbi:Gfo/Idh/MocA family protein [Cellulosilyticum ruminicola]|uniref:Gfo/Idh/MocA family protein n=1 Tax=Cellulosilyticum ruminicola TaxID=425254 RepID=UPI0006D06162|nr:Gfo/Idh/MocA family oxidoreductase [Cellulosilyticum ruminicola]
MKIGIIGAGRIAETMAKTLCAMEDAVCYAVAARDIQRAEGFANKFNMAKAYGSYEELVADKEVELVYIATPHSLHYEHAKLCITHGKHVLCEKAFTRNVKEAEEIIALAKSKNVLITEAIWTRYMPSRQMIDDLIASGIIGKPAALTANLGYVIWNKERIAEPSLAGGSLLDIGLYPINFALMHFGKDIKEITSTAVLSDKRVDLQNSITITYIDGKIAVLNSTVLAQTDRQGIISGDKGYMVIENINNCESIKIYDLGRQLIKEIKVPMQITGYEYEVKACIEAIQNSQLECEAMPHAETLYVMQLMDDLRSKWGVVYPNE